MWVWASPKIVLSCQVCLKKGLQVLYLLVWNIPWQKGGMMIWYSALQITRPISGLMRKFAGTLSRPEHPMGEHKTAPPQMSCICFWSQTTFVFFPFWLSDSYITYRYISYFLLHFDPLDPVLENQQRRKNISWSLSEVTFCFHKSQTVGGFILADNYPYEVLLPGRYYNWNNQQKKI